MKSQGVTKVWVGTGRTGGTTTFWMEGTRQEVTEAIGGKFKVFFKRPTEAFLGKANGAKKVTKAAPKPEAATAGPATFGKGA